jgi:hypothetical protein
VLAVRVPRVGVGDRGAIKRHPDDASPHVDAQKRTAAAASVWPGASSAVSQIVSMASALVPGLAIAVS